MLENCCCGLPAWSYGDLKAARNLATRNLSTLASEKFDVIVTDCSSCASFLKNYAQLFLEADKQYEKSREVSARVKDMVQLIHTMQTDAPSSDPAVTVMKFSTGCRVLNTAHCPKRTGVAEGQVLMHLRIMSCRSRYWIVKWIILDKPAPICW